MATTWTEACQDFPLKDIGAAIGVKEIGLPFPSPVDIGVKEIGLPLPSPVDTGVKEIGLPFPSPGDLPDPGIKLGSPALQADSLPAELEVLLNADTRTTAPRIHIQCLSWVLVI